MKRTAVGLLALIVAACASGPISVPRLASSRGVGVGPQRLVVEFVDRATNASMTAPGVEVVATLRDRDGSPLVDSTGEFAWLVDGERGAVVFTLDIPEPGTYQVTFAAEDVRFSGPLGFEALESTPVIGVGEPAPRSETRSTADHALSQISSDPEPEASLYDTTVAEAVEGGIAVLVFGSPAHCLSMSCATVLELVKGIAPDFPHVDFVHVETVEDPQAAVGVEATHVAAVSEWGLVVEPVVFVVVDGLVTAYFESALTERELRLALGDGSG